jgi:hypothetical protein
MYGSYSGSDSVKKSCQFLTFGKHKGKPLSEVPRSYLHWLLGQAWLKPSVRQAVECELFGGIPPVVEQGIDDIIAATITPLDQQTGDG